MDAATAKQKAYVRKLFVKCGTPRWVFNPLNLWNISKQGADSLINDLLVLRKYHHGDLREMICQTLEGKNILQGATRTIDELEESEEQATYDPTTEDWLDQQTYDGIPQKEWIHNLHQDVFRERGVQNA